MIMYNSVSEELVNDILAQSSLVKEVSKEMVG